MTDIYFQKYLNKESIDKIKDQYGFRYPLFVEKFIMDFKVLAHIQKAYATDRSYSGGVLTNN